MKKIPNRRPQIRRSALPPVSTDRKSVTTTPLKALLLEELRKGPITFGRYMNLCLYHPEHGYYMQGRERTGARGDYFTSSDVHPIFARLLARQADEMWRLLGQPRRFTWVEMGAGRGWFARDFIGWTAVALPEFAAALDYAAIEPSSKQRDRIRERIGEKLGERLRLLASLDELEPVAGCFFSNELVDSFPVAVVTRSGGRLKEIYVTLRDGELAETTGPLSDSTIAQAIARATPELEEGHRVEVCRAAVDWMGAVAAKLERGFVLTIDYGDLAPALYSSPRPRGMLLSYLDHRVTENFFSAPGEQDLTAHVNFSALIEAGRKAGLEPVGFTSQERFLLALGEANEFADLYDPHQSEAEKLQARLKLKLLIHAEGPDAMGNVFKVLAQSRGVERPELTGLKYQRAAERRAVTSDPSTKLRASK